MHVYVAGGTNGLSIPTAQFRSVSTAATQEWRQMTGGGGGGGRSQSGGVPHLHFGGIGTCGGQSSMCGDGLTGPENTKKPPGGFSGERGREKREKDPGKGVVVLGWEWGCSRGGEVCPARPSSSLPFSGPPTHTNQEQMMLGPLGNSGNVHGALQPRS